MPGTEPVSTLRGAGVAPVDGRRLGRLFAWVCIAGLAVATVVLSVAGAHKNSQITALRTQGVAVSVTVTGCLGQIGGSGSNPVGYDCTGTYRLAGRRYHQHIPDGAYHETGSKVRGVAVPSDPLLLSTPAIVAGEHASNGVYAVPGVLGVLAAVGAVALVVAGRRRRSATGSG